jgi:hypothetical protein
MVAGISVMLGRTVAEAAGSMDLCDCQPANGETKHRHYCKSFDVFHIQMLLFVPWQRHVARSGCSKITPLLESALPPEMTTAKREMSAPKREMNGIVCESIAPYPEVNLVAVPASPLGCCTGQSPVDVSLGRNFILSQYRPS